TRLGAFARADDAAAFQFVHDARGARVAEAQAPLHQRDARLLFAADDFDALLYEFLVLVDAGFVPETGGGLGKLPVNFQVVVRFALLGNEPNDAVDFLVGDKRPLGANQLRRAGRQIQHVALAEQFVRAHRVENRARVHPRRALERDTRGDVRLDDAGDDVHARPLGGDDAMNARRARHLRDARDGHFHVGGRHQHQVRQLVNDDDDVAQPFGNDDVLLARHNDFLVHFDGESFRARLDLFPFGGERQFGFGLRQRLVFRARIERVDVADADARENLVALFHFI